MSIVLPKRLFQFVLIPQLCLFALGVIACQSVPPLEPPQFDYRQLSNRYFRSNLGGHFPLTIQRGANLHPITTATGHLFYTSNRDGSGDIWMRDLSNTVNVPLIQHPAEQYRPAVPDDGTRLVFVSEDADSNGDLRIVNIDPEEIVQNMIDGISPGDLWDNSRDLSARIEELAQELPEVCRGESAETDPVWRPDGSALVFASDRCSPGTYNLWMVRMEDDEPVGPLIPVTTEGGVQPRFNMAGDALAFISYRNNHHGGRPYIVYFVGMREVEVPLPRNAANSAYIYTNPSFGQNGTHLYYTSIRRDTNKNGSIDRNDNGALYSLKLNANGGVQQEKQLLDNEHNILSSIYTDFIGGSFLYAAELYNSVNIYFIQPQGVVPAENTIEEQYNLTLRYRSENPDRYLLSLDTVRQQFGQTPEFFLYRGRIMIDRLVFQQQRGRLNKTDSIDDNLTELIEHNPYAKLEWQLHNAGNSGADPIPILEDFLRQIDAGAFTEKLSTTQIALMRAATMERLARAYARGERSPAALETVRTLNADYPDYYLHFQTLKLEANLQTALERRVSPVFNTLLAQNDLPAYIKEEIHADLYEYLYQKRTPREARELAQRELERTDLAPFIQTTLRIALARAMFDEGEFDESFQQCEQILRQIPVRDAGGRLLPDAGWSAAFVRTWQTISYIHSKRGDYSAAYHARLVYGGAYSPESRVSIDTEDFLEIIEESESYINLYLRTARSMRETIADRESTVTINREITDTINVLTDVKVDIGAPEMEVLSEFCGASSRSRILFTSLGPKPTQQYLEFCEGNRELINERRHSEMSLSSARDAVDLLYTASYASTSLLNILFLNMKKLGVLPELYERRAVYYHRLKIDVASEKNQFLLDNRQKEFLVLDREDILDLFATTDPYKSQTFDQLLYGYRAIQAEASEVGDLSMHYGHAYALIKKNVEKEAFYDRIQSNGVRLPADLLRDKKKEILRDFKNAEYLLQYILNVNPLHVDAYLLLGWLHQYIDERRNVRLEIEPSYIEQVYEYFTGTSQQPTDGRFYSEIYLIYFPDNLYEGNIELYRQALEKVSGADPEPLQLASLNLNLANNYFKLLNFKRAINHYEEVERLRNVAGKSPFNGYAQRALFHFNLGRALFYEDRPAEGARHLLEAYQIYDEFERKPLHEQFSTLRFIMYSRDTSEYGPEIDRKLIRQKLEELTVKSDEVRTRMSLIAALIGLAYWRAGDYEEAILFYRDAEFRLYKSGEPPPGAIDRSSLMNFIALAYQSMQEFSISDEHARQAGSYARDPGLVHYDLRYQPQTIGGRMLGCILDYGEDFSVIGEGRNPYGFSPLRQYELSLGIQLENMILKGDLDQAAYLLRQRRQVFQTLDIKLQLGRMGYVSTLNREALNYFEAGNFEEAANSFQKAAGIARKYNLLSSFRLNFTNRYRALFATFEQPDVDGRIARQRIDRGLEEVREFREQYAEKARDDFIRQRESEIPDYEFDPERDGPSLQRKINSELVDIKAIEATLYFYRARLRENRNANTDRANQSDYRAALQRYDELLQAPATTPGQIMTQIRRRLNRAQILHAMGNLLQARRELNDIVEVTYEYNMLAEEWHAHFLLARLHQELYEIYNQREDAVRTGNQLDQAVAILREHPEIHPQLQRSLESFFNFATGSLIARNNPERALFMQEWSWEYALRNEYFRYPLKFENRQYSQAYDRLRSTRLLLARLNRDESVLRIQRSDFARVVQRKERLSQTLDELRTGLVNTRPGQRPFVQNTPEAATLRPGITRDQALIRFFTHEGRIHAWCFIGPSLVFASREYDGIDAVTPVRSLLADCPGGRNLHDVFVIPDRTVYALDLNAVLAEINPALPAPVYTTRLNSNHVGFLDRTRSMPPEWIHLFNVKNKKRYDSLEEVEENQKQPDVLEVSPDSSPIMFSANEYQNFNARDWVSRDRFTALVLSDSGPGDPDSNKSLPPNGLRTAATQYEIFRSSGAATLAVVRTEKYGEGRTAVLDARGRERYTSPDVRIFGSPGFALTQNLDRVTDLHQRARAQGELQERNDNLLRARDYYHIASSYLWNHPREEDIFFENELNLARVDLQLFSGYRSTEGLDLLIQRYSYPADPVRLRRVFTMAIETMLIQNQPDIAQKYLNDYLLLFPGERGSIVRRTQLLEFIARLKQPVYGPDREANAAFFSEFQTTLGQIVQAPEASEIVESLVLHGMYDHALLVANTLAGQNRTQARALLNLIATDRALIVGSDLEPGNADANDQASVRLIDRARRLDWSAYQQLLEELPNEQGLAIKKFRQRLYSQWWNHLHQLPVNVIDIGDVSVSEGTTAYKVMTPLERALIFRLLVENIARDPELQIAQLLYQMIESEQRSFSVNRAGLMALGTARAYLLNEDFNNAVRFFRAYQDKEDAQIPRDPVRLRAARIGVALSPLELDREINRRTEDYAKTLFGMGSEETVALYAAIPLEFKPENWKPFTDLMPADTADEEAVADYSIALSILKEQAMRRQDWDNLLNVAFYQQATRDYFQSMRYGIPAQRPTFERITENIQARLPAGQHFVGLADTATQAARITITSRELTGSKLRYTGRNLRGKMHAFLDGLRVGADVSEAYLSLSRQYRSLFGIGWTDVTYFWFPGVHGMAPIRPERGDLLFQVSNPAQFVRNPILKLSTEYPPRFQVHLAGADQSDRTRGLSDADAILQQQRMLNMEKLSLGLTAADGPRHILFSLIGPEDFSGLERFLHGLDTTAVSPWFFSGNQLIRNPASEITNYNLLLAMLGQKLQGTGVVTLRFPPALGHPYYIRYFYNRDLPAVSVFRRFVAAYYNLRRTVADEGALYGYRLVANNILTVE